RDRSAEERMTTGLHTTASARDGTRLPLDSVQERVFLDRYALTAADGTPLERSPAAMWRRGGPGLAAAEGTAGPQGARAGRVEGDSGSGARLGGAVRGRHAGLQVRARRPRPLRSRHRPRRDAVQLSAP